jgi:hypothetical protein
MARPKGKKTRRKHKVDAETEERQAEAKKLQERYGKKVNFRIYYYILVYSDK